MEGGIALAVGAGDALVAAKVGGTAPGGIPWPVAYELGGVLVGIIGGKVGVPTEARDTVLLSSLALLGARGARVAMAGKLLSGPAAWGGVNTADAVGGGSHTMTAGAKRPQLVAAARGGGPGGWYAPTSEAAGVVG